MRLNIVIPYRPLSGGVTSSPDVKLYQNEKGEWNGEGIKPCLDNEANVGGCDDDAGIGPFKTILDRGIYFLNKHSKYRHNIIVSIDNDVHPNDDFLKEYDNVTVCKCPPVPDNKNFQPWRINWAQIGGVKAVPDEEWLCYSYLADFICSKNWDEPIINAINKMGEKYVYSPMLVEVVSTRDSKTPIAKPSPKQIWADWRANWFGYLLTMGEPAKGYITIEDMDDYIEIAGKGHHLLPQKCSRIIEPCGARVYGYTAGYIAKAKYMKQNLVFSGPGYEDENGKYIHNYDLAMDDNFRDATGHMKVVLADSFYFHPYCSFKMETP